MYWYEISYNGRTSQWAVISTVVFVYDAECDLLAVAKFLLIACAWVAVVEGSDGEDRLFKELFETRQYNKHSHPVANLSQTTHVQLAIVLLKIVQVVCIIHAPVSYPHGTARLILYGHIKAAEQHTII